MEVTGKIKRRERCLLAISLGFSYEKTTGNVITPTGKILQKKTKNGYLSMTLRDKDRKRQVLLAHQFAFFSVYCKVVDLIDHIDGNKTNNIISNLRSVNKSQNSMNMRNVKGYAFCKRSKKYLATIMVNYKRIHLGTFETPEEASQCYLENKKKYHIIN